MVISKDICYIGVNDYDVDLFEGQYSVPNGMSYNSYVILDDKIAVMDTVDARFGEAWLENLESALQGKTPDYLIIQHMEPDHSANIERFIEKYPQTVVVSSAPAFTMMKNLFGVDYKAGGMVIKEGDTLQLGKHLLQFVAAPMVHWPEVIVTYDSYEKVLFSADGFGTFGAVEKDVSYTDWAKEARRYYIGICGKFGIQVQALLKKAAALDIQMICPLHGPVLKENLGYYINLYDTWSSYKPESDGVVIAYTSVYGHTKEAVAVLEASLKDKQCETVVYDLARTDMSEALADAFRCKKLILATTTYNADIFPYMKTFIQELKAHNYQNRVVGLVENGMWAPMAARLMKASLEECKGLQFMNTAVKITAALNIESENQIKQLAQEICES